MKPVPAQPPSFPPHLRKGPDLGYGFHYDGRPVTRVDFHDTLHRVFKSVYGAELPENYGFERDPAGFAQLNREREEEREQDRRRLAAERPQSAKYNPADPLGAAQPSTSTPQPDAEPPSADLAAPAQTQTQAQPAPEGGVMKRADLRTDSRDDAIRERGDVVAVRRAVVVHVCRAKLLRRGRPRIEQHRRERWRIREIGAGLSRRPRPANMPPRRGYGSRPERIGVLLMTTSRHLRHLLLTTLTAAAMLCGCALPGPLPDHAERVKRAYIYYLDGAGGGSAARNWGLGLRDGLLDAGYRGSGEMFAWETGAGVAADQVSSVKYKSGKATELSKRILAFKRDNPGVPVHIIALSAGTAVAAFTLEVLPESASVDTVIFLGASIGADYDMTEALKRIKNKLYIFTSERDAVLTYAIPAAGTADRERSGARPAGLTGFVLPPKASAGTRTLYRQKIETIPWRNEFWWTGNFGGHTDGVKSDFVKKYIAPLIIQRGYADTKAGA